MLPSIVSPTTRTRKLTPADRWALVDPWIDGPVRWYYGHDDSGFRQMFWTYPHVDPASLPNFVRYDNPADIVPDRLSDDPNTPAPPVGPGPCPF